MVYINQARFDINPPQWQSHSARLPSAYNNKMNKIDLLFQKQPPHIQRKLMNLLLHYNAMMQYNQSQDKFEVDLLLPFKDHRQKEQFVNNFMSRRSRDDEQGSIIDGYGSGARGSIIDGFGSGGGSGGAEVGVDGESEIGREQQSSREQEISLDFTNQCELSARRNTVSLRDISLVIKNKIKGAIQQIKNHTPSNATNTPLQQQQPQHSHNSSLRLQKVQMQQQPHTILGQLGQEHPTDYNSRHHKKRSSSQRQSQSAGDDQILIEDEAEDNQQMGMQADPGNYNTEARQQPASVEQRAEYNTQPKPRIQPHPKTQTQPRTQTIQALKSKMASKHRPPSSAPFNPSATRSKYNEFIRRNQRDLARIYDTIRKDIKRNQKQVTPVPTQDPILVLEDDINGATSEQDRIFKEEVIKEYQKHIVAQNENMSSEDLVRYFRYLLQNAKNLYVKNLRQGR